MISYQSKGSWVAFIIFLPLILIIARYEFKVMTSTYNKDLGNGVVIYADDYVKSGLWVFDCKYRRLVSRQPLPTPFLELKQATTFSIVYKMAPAEVQFAGHT
ncbi:hypothetical protein, partial [Pseudomonas nicosulfuronedens]|uniref:hypothetical protein n=1 Tax=Pseudomonas nicosulfuronedens TaxID=2571105 RepID=UPI001C5528DF